MVLFFFSEPCFLYSKPNFERMQGVWLHDRELVDVSVLLASMRRLSGCGRGLRVVVGLELGRECWVTKDGCRNLICNSAG